MEVDTATTSTIPTYTASQTLQDWVQQPLETRKQYLDFWQTQLQDAIARLPTSIHQGSADPAVLKLYHASSALMSRIDRMDKHAKASERLSSQLHTLTTEQRQTLRDAKECRWHAVYETDTRHQCGGRIGPMNVDYDKMTYDVEWQNTADEPSVNSASIKKHDPHELCQDPDEREPEPIPDEDMSLDVFTAAIKTGLVGTDTDGAARQLSQLTTGLSGFFTQPGGIFTADDLPTLVELFKASSRYLDASGVAQQAQAENLFRGYMQSNIEKTFGECTKEEKEAAEGVLTELQAHICNTDAFEQRTSIFAAYFGDFDADKTGGGRESKIPLVWRKDVHNFRLEFGAEP